MITYFRVSSTVFSETWKKGALGNKTHIHVLQTFLDLGPLFAQLQITPGAVQSTTLIPPHIADAVFQMSQPSTRASLTVGYRRVQALLVTHSLSLLTLLSLTMRKDRPTPGSKRSVSISPLPGP